MIVHAEGFSDVNDGRQCPTGIILTSITKVHFVL